MRAPSVLHPDFVWHVQPTVDSFMTARARVYRNSGRPDWEPGVGNVTSGDRQIWEGACRVQPNIDWRARARDNQGEIDATMSVRINLPMHKNEYGATLTVDGDIQTYAADPMFAFGDVVEIVQTAGPGQRTLLNKRFTVRNALPSTTMFEHDLLCDVGTSLHG